MVKADLFTENSVKVSTVLTKFPKTRSIFRQIGSNKYFLKSMMFCNNFPVIDYKKLVPLFVKSKKSFLLIIQICFIESQRQLNCFVRFIFSCLYLWVCIKDESNTTTIICSLNFIEDNPSASFLTPRHNCDVRKDSDQSNRTIVNLL